MNNIFAERLKKAMEQKNMKQIDLVKKAAEQGVKLGKSHVSQYQSVRDILLQKVCFLPEKQSCSMHS